MFCIRPNPLEFESLTGYLYRLAAANHSTVYMLCKVLNINMNYVNLNWFTREILNRFCSLTGIESETAHVMMNGPFVKAGGEEISHQILKNGVKFCPCCVQETVYHNRLWFLHCYNVCHKHGIILVDRCEQCGGNIKMHSLFNGSCSSCGFLLIRTEKRAEEVSNYLIQLNQSLILNSPFLFDQHGPYTYVQFLKLAQYSFHLIDGHNDFTGSLGKTIRAFHKKKGRQQLNEDMMISLSNVVWMYSNFINNFYTVLDVFSKRKDRSAYVTKSTFERLFDDPSFLKIQEAYENYWLQKLNKGEIRRDFSVFKKNTDLLDKRTFIRKEEAKNQYSNNKIMALAAAKKINIVNTESERGYLIEGESLRRYQNSMKEYLNKNESAEFLGIRRNAVPRLIESGLITEHVVEASKSKLMKRTELEGLLSTCRGHGTTSTNLRDMISFEHALSSHNVNGLTMDVLINFMLKGYFRPVFTKKNGGFSSCYLRIYEIRLCVDMLKDRRRKELGLFREEVMKKLKMGEKKMKVLCERGILVPDKILTLQNGRKRYLYSEDKVIQYTKEGK